MKRWVLLLPSALLALWALGQHSQNPTFFGRYSPSFLVFHLLNLSFLGFTFYSLQRPSSPGIGLGLGGLLALSYLITANDAIAGSFFLPLIHLSRISLGLLCLFASFLISDQRLTERPRRASRLPILGSLALSLAFVDLSYYGWLTLRGEEVRYLHPFATFYFRSPVDLKSIEPDSIVVVGDSFVWGLRVEEGKVFPAVLQGILQERSRITKVYNLGQNGAALPEYLAVLKQVPKKRRVIVCYYMNDMPRRETLPRRIRGTLRGVGRASLLARLASDRISRWIHPSPAAVTKAVIAEYDRADPSFPKRWNKVSSSLNQIALEAKRGSREQPILVLFPLMVRFSEYPLTESHLELAQLGRSAGFQVVDFLQDFSRSFPDGEKFLVSPGDNHFNAKVHARVAEVLAGLL